MVRLIGPGLSSGASGTLANTLTFGKTGKTHTLRKKPTPKQPRSGLQISMRAALQFLTLQWKEIGSGNRASWANAYPDPQLNNYNAYIRYNLKRWRSKLPPTFKYPASDESLEGIEPTAEPTGHVRHVDLEIYLDEEVNQNWGILIFHRFNTPPGNEVDRLVRIQFCPDSTTRYWTHQPLPAGTHHYQAHSFSVTGKINWTDYNTGLAVVT